MQQATAQGRVLARPRGRVRPGRETDTVDAPVPHAVLGDPAGGGRGLAFFRGLALALPVGAGLWAGVIWGLVRLLR